MYYVIKSLSMCNYLVRKGFDIVKVVDSKENPRFKVFLFTDCPELQIAMKSYKNKK